MSDRGHLRAEIRGDDRGHNVPAESRPGLKQDLLFSINIEPGTISSKPGFDVYGYVTLTSDQDTTLSVKIADFVDRLQLEVHPLFPLRTIPQRIIEFTPTKERIKERQQKAFEIQNSFTA